MATPRYDRAAELVAELVAAGIPATRSPAEANVARPCVLVPPPTLGPGGYGGPTVTWRLVALAKDPLGSEASWQQLDELVAAVWDALPVERAEPSSYVQNPAADPLPAYVITYTES